MTKGSVSSMMRHVSDRPTVDGRDTKSEGVHRRSGTWVDGVGWWRPPWQPPPSWRASGGRPPPERECAAPTAEARRSRSGMTQDIDSLNPFTGHCGVVVRDVPAELRHAHRLRAGGLLAKPALASSWDVSDDGLTWTYHIRPDLTWSDGQPLTAHDVAYTFNRIMQRQVRADELRQLRRRASRRSTAPDDTTVVMKVKKPTPIMLHLFVYILPEHIWKDISEKEVKSFANEPGPDGIVGSGPVHRHGVPEGPVHPARGATPTTGAWQAARRPAGLPDLPERGLAGPGAQARGDRLRRRPGRERLQQPQGRRRHQDRAGHVLGLRRDRLQHRRRAGRRDADRRRAPGAEGPQAVRVALAYAIDTQAHRRPGVRRVRNGRHAASSRRSTRTCTTTRAPAPYTFDLAEGRTSCSTTPATRRAPDGIRTMPNGTKPLTSGSSGAATRRPASRSVQFVAGWLKDVGIDVKTKIVSEDALTEIIGQGNFDMFEWGWVVEPDPNYQLSTFTCANRSYKDSGSIYAEPVGLVLLRQGLRRSSYAKQADADRHRAAGRDGQADAEDGLRRRAVRRSPSTTTTSRPTAPTGSPTSRRSRSRTGRCCSSTAPTATRAFGPVTAKDTNGSSGGAAAAASSESSSNAPMIAIGGRRPGGPRGGRLRAGPPPAPGARGRVAAGQCDDGGPVCRDRHRLRRRPRRGPSPGAASVRWTARPADLRRAPGHHRGRHAGVRPACSTSSCSGCCPVTRSRSTPAGATWTRSSSRELRRRLNQPHPRAVRCTTSRTRSPPASTPPSSPGRCGTSSATGCGRRGAARHGHRRCRRSSAS